MKRRIARLILLFGLTLAAVPAWLRTLWLVLTGDEDPQERALRGLDQFGNAGLLNGSNYETISSHVGRRVHFDIEPPLWARALGATLDFLDPGHCWRAAVDEAPILDAILKASRPETSK